MIQPYVTRIGVKQVPTLIHICLRYKSNATKLQNLRGMPDQLPSTSHLYTSIVSKATDVCKLYGYRQIDTPILEPTELFVKGLETSEVMVGKELYRFVDSNSDTEVSLRPEGTAGVVKASVRNNLLVSNLPLRLYYYGPYFRRERPQKGRLRQFHQFGIETFNDANPNADVQTISLAKEFLDKLKLDTKVTLHINSLGDDEDRKVYLKLLIEYLQLNKNKLSSLSQSRIEINPLRVLDSKDSKDIEVLNDAPKLMYSLSPKSLLRFKTVLTYLDESNIDYVVDHRLVRGLDYYNHTIFEFKAESDNLGSTQTTILAGGRYDGLVEKLFGKEDSSLTSTNKLTAAIGWACGIERLALIANSNYIVKEKRKVIVVALTEINTFAEKQGSSNQKIMEVAQLITTQLRKEGYPTVIETPFYENKLSLAKWLKKVTTVRDDLIDVPSKIVIVGSDEVNDNLITVKDIDTNTQRKCRLEELKDCF